MLIGISGYIGSGKDTLASMLNYWMYVRKFETSNTSIDLQKCIDSNTNLPLSYEEWLKYNIWSGWKIRRFADTLKEMVAILTGCTREQLESQEFKASNTPECWDRTVTEAYEWLSMKPVFYHVEPSEEEIIKDATTMGFKWKRTYREMLQEIGTDLFRTRFHPNTWVNSLMSRYRPYTVPGRETHFAGESLMSGMLSDMPTMKWPNWIVPDMRFPNEAKAIQNANGVLIRINRGPRTSDHSSETALDNFKEFDFVVDNSGSFSDLLEKAKQLTEQFKFYDYADTNNKPIMG